jgi:Hedgehog amino-terminal signalling domain
LRVLPTAFVMLAAVLPFSIAPLDPMVTLAAGACPGDISNVSAASLSGDSIPAEYTGDWNVAYALGDIAFTQRTKAGGGMVDEDIGHEALNFTFNVDKHGYASGKSKAIFHFDVKAYSVAFPDQVSAHAYLVGNRQRRVFTIQGRACGDGKIRIESTKVPDLLLFDGAAQKSIGAWNIFPPQDETIAEVDKHLTITSTAYVKQIKMHLKWKASKCITFALGEHRDAAGNKETAETTANGPFATLPITDTSIITYTNPNVQFDPEANTHRMKASLTGPLAALATLVTKEWPEAKPPIKVYVYRAWGAPGSHGANSFHYSGQALDLNLSDFDHAKYGCLAGLAYEAGFGWSYYENANHVHVSSR